MLFFVCNWKTFIETENDAIGLAISYVASKNKNNRLIIAPSSIHLPAVVKATERQDIYISSQDIAISSDKPQTGRISPKQLNVLGVNYSIVGHFETRSAGITNKSVSEKINTSLENNITPIVCLSELGVEETEKGEKVLDQLEELIMLCKETGNLNKVIFAYEPTAYIGGAESLPIEDIQFIINKLKNKLKEEGIDTPILYGGSVNEETAEKIIKNTDVSGLLMGRIGIQTEKINEILKKQI